MAVEMGHTEVYVDLDGLPGWMRLRYPTTTTERLPKVKKLKRIQAKQLKQLIDDKADFTIVDIRPIYELKRGLIDIDMINATLSNLCCITDIIPRNKRVIIIDFNGKRGRIAYRYFHMKGLTDLSILSGGMSYWIQAGFPIVDYVEAQHGLHVKEHLDSK